MNKIYGATERQDGLYHIGRNKWEIIFGFGKDSEGDEVGYNYRHRFDHQPTFDEIKAVISKQIDSDTDAAIVNGMVWNGISVKLDSETENNIIGLLALLALSGGGLFPKTFKLGEQDGNAVFHQFKTAEEFTEFAKAASEHKQRQYSIGWEQKALITEETYTAP